MISWMLVGGYVCFVAIVGGWRVVAVLLLWFSVAWFIGSDGCWVLLRCGLL